MKKTIAAKKKSKRRTKKSANKSSVSKALVYSDGRENDAIGRALRRMAEGGDVSELWDTDGNGKLSDSEKAYRDKMVDKYGSLEKAREALKKNTDTNSDDKTALNRWDTNENGKVGPAEEKQKEYALSEYDKDGDGKISAEEYRAYKKSEEYKDFVQRQQAKQGDGNNTGKDTKENNQNSMVIDEFKEQTAKRMDAIRDDYDKQISKLLAKGYIDKDQLVKKAYTRAENIGNVGSEMLNKAQATALSVKDQYKDAKNYDKTNFGDLEGRAAAASDYQKVGFDDVEGMARDANYNKTAYNDLERSAGVLSQYDTGEFSDEDYTTGNIQSRMSPYEQLVAERARQRLKRDYDEGRGERETEAARAGAFGGSAAAVKEMADRRNYRDALADLNAQSLQNAYQSAADLTSRADDSRNRAEVATEQSRQYGADMGMKGWEAQLTARNATSNEEARKSQQQLAQAELTGNLRSQSAAEEQAQTQYALQGVSQQQAAREAAANEVARAKEAELAGIAGQGTSSQLMSGLSRQELDQYIAKSNAMNQAGMQAMDYELDKQEYPLSLMERNMNINTSAVSGTPLNTTPKASEPSGWERGLGIGMAGASILNNVAGAIDTGLDWFKDGGLIRRHRMNDGGQVQPQRPQLIVNLANGGIVDLHNAMFRRK